MSEIPPALTPEEWAMWGDFGLNNDKAREDAAEQALSHLMDDDAFLRSTDSARHPLAALALHGQPYGFTREDVAALEMALNHWQDGAPHEEVKWRVLESLASRIEALLPPRTP